MKNWMKCEEILKEHLWEHRHLWRVGEQSKIQMSGQSGDREPGEREVTETKGKWWEEVTSHFPNKPSFHGSETTSAVPFP